MSVEQVTSVARANHTSPYRLDLAQIEASLREVQDSFDAINATLAMRRDPMTDEVLENMLAGYQYVDALLQQPLDLLHRGQSAHLLELNALVLMGRAPQQRSDFAQHLQATEAHFFAEDRPRTEAGIGQVIDWYGQHQDDNIWRRTAGVYISVVSQPQLYLEGNHRTGSLIMSYLLAREGKPPFVLSIENARAFFDPSTLAKQTRKNSMSMMWRKPKLVKRFAELLKATRDKDYLL